MAQLVHVLYYRYQMMIYFQSNLFHFIVMNMLMMIAH
nr:MAG TPA: hypothetical protein [Caudoviricetes sp.]